MSDPKGEGPPTIRPARVSTPSPDIEIRQSNPEDLVLANAPPHIQLTVRELRETRELINKREAAALEREIAEQKRADVRHDDAQQLQKELLQLPILASAIRKMERKLEQLREQLVVTRKDIGSMADRLDMLHARTDDHHLRLEALEAHAGIVHNGIDDDTPTRPPESAP